MTPIKVNLGSFLEILRNWQIVIEVWAGKTKIYVERRP